MSDTLQAKNKKTMLMVLGAIVFMVGLSFAAVPLYQIFCKVTGFGGTTQEASVAPMQVFDRVITVQLNADTNPNLPWDFKPEVRKVDIKVGQEALVAYSAKNMSDTPVVGTAVYNVTPLKAGKYFTKTECFCFQEQLLKPDQAMHMPVNFFVDPAIMEDRRMDDIQTITLSYTFYPAQSSDLENAQEKVYNEIEKMNNY